MKLQDRVCMITGGARGLGLEFARGFIREGASLAICGTSEGALAQAMDELDAAASGRQVFGRIADVADETAVQAFVAEALERLGRIDVLVNNAGIIGPTASVDQVSREDWDRTLAVNLTGAFLCAKAVLPQMAERRYGKIINISSVAGHKGYPLRSPYAVSKWGMIGLSKTLAQEWGRYNIQVNTISPGPVRGERMAEVIRRRAAQTNRPVAEIEKEYTGRLALERFAEPANIVALAIYLASSEGDSITGETIQVSCGYGLS